MPTPASTNHTARQARVILQGSLLLICVSCGTNEVVTQIPEDHVRLKALATVYAYACRDLGRPPRNSDDLLPTFAKAGIESTDEYFLSTRYGTPYVIIWGVDLDNNKYRGSDLILVYERVGIEGSRLAIACNHSLVEIDEDKFKALSWPAGHQPD